MRKVKTEPVLPLMRHAKRFKSDNKPQSLLGHSKKMLNEEFDSKIR